jgi:hypothetical protein
MWRFRLTLAALALALAALAGVAWLSRHPDTPWLVRAESRPVVGPLARALRRAFGPAARPPGGGPGAGSSRERGPAVEIIVLPPRPIGHLGLGTEPASQEPAAGSRPVTDSPPPPGSGTAGPLGASEEVWLLPGTALRGDPRGSAPALATIEAIANLPVLERRGDWARVAYRRREGWALAPARSDGPPLGSAAEPVRPVLALAPDPLRLSRALAALGVTGAGGPADRDLAREASAAAGSPASPGAAAEAPAAVSPPPAALGPYRLYTDVDRPELLRFLAAAADAVEPAYRERYRREPLGEPAEAVVLFADEARYRRFQAQEARLAGLAASGHAGHGIVALYAGEETPTAIAATLIHELVHLVNRRALGPALPPWLDEGLAGDLGASALSAEGILLPDVLGGEIAASPGRIDYHGARASLRRLREAIDAGTAPRLGSLLALAWEEFVAPPRSELHYAASALFLRYLASAEGGALAPALRSFLKAVSEGEPPTAEALTLHLGRPLARLELGFRAWVAARDEGQRPVEL